MIVVAKSCDAAGEKRRRFMCTTVARVRMEWTNDHQGKKKLAPVTPEDAGDRC